MRKNGVMREVIEISGGVCAPSGFTCASAQNKNGDKAALFLSDGRSAVAVVDRREKKTKGFVSRYISRDFDGNAKLVVAFCGGVETNEKQYTPAIREAFSKIRTRFCVTERDVQAFSTGEFLYGSSKNTLDFDFVGVSFSQDTAFVKEALCGKGKAVEYACCFYLGDTRINFGFLGRTGRKDCAESSFIMITTDANISSEMLQKALESEERNVFRMAISPFYGAPSDTVVMMASGKAGNAKIAYEDVEYDKFCIALRLATAAFSKLLIKNVENDRVVECIVLNAKSKLQAREIAVSLASSIALRAAVEQRIINLSAVTSAIVSADSSVDFSRLTVLYSNDKKSIKAMENGGVYPINQERAREILSENTAYLTVDLNGGNYSSSAWFCISDSDEP